MNFYTLIAPFFCLLLVISINCHDSSAYDSSAAEGTNSTNSYENFGFSFQYPASWALGSATGSRTAGSLELAGSCERVSINWTRSPGIDVEKIADQLLKTYGSDGVKLVDFGREEISMKDGRAVALHLSYQLKGYTAEERFVVWSSNESDRLFIASISGCASGNRTRTYGALLDNIVTSFSDLEEREHIHLGLRPSKEESWSLVLGDLLSSYSYKDAKTLPARVARMQVLHTLSPVNGTYQLDSREGIDVDPPETAISRAGAVQSLLLENGYNARIVQQNGELGVAVLDPSGRWQLISINPAKPDRSVGVLANGTGDALVYDSLDDLVDDNGMSIKDLSRDLDLGLNPGSSLNSDSLVQKLMQKDCEPSQYVELKGPSKENEPWIEDLQNTLNGYDYGERYQENVFDCSNTAQVCWSILQDKGYDARLMMSWKGHPLGPHMWVAVRYPYQEERYVPVETANTDGSMRLVHLGHVVGKDDYYRGIMYNSSAQYSRLHPEEGMWLDKKF